MSLAESLKSIVGEVNASDSELDRAVYATDASRKKGKCEAVAWPSDLEQVHKLVMLARRSNIPLMNSVKSTWGIPIIISRMPRMRLNLFGFFKS